MLLRDHIGNKVYNLLFLRYPYHQLSAIKDIVSYSFVFYYWVYIFETVCKITVFCSKSLYQVQINSGKMEKQKNSEAKWEKEKQSK